MTGAGAASVAFVKNTDFDTLPGSPTYYSPGHDIEVTQLNFENTLQRLRTPDTAEAVDSIRGNFQGALEISYTMSNDVHDDVRDIVFNSGGTSIASGAAPVSTWYIGTDYLDTSFATQTVEIECRHTIPLQYQLQYEQGTNTVRETLTMAFGDLRKNTTTTPGSITGPSVGSDAAFHGVTLTIDATTVNREQSIALSFEGPLYRYYRDSSPFPAAATTAVPAASLESTVIYHTDDYLGLGLGGTTGSTQPQTSLSNVSGSLAFDTSGGTTIATYSFSKLKMNRWEGQSLVNPDADFTGVARWHVNDGVSIS